MIILPSLEIVPAKYNGSTLLSQIPVNGTGDFTVTRATSATRVNGNGLIEVARTNLFLQSAGFEVSENWLRTNITVTTGSTAAFTAPDNSTNADLITATASVPSFINQNTTIASGTYTISVFAKAGNYGLFRIGNVSSAERAAWFNLNAGVVTGTVNGGTASMQNYGNGWYRCIYTSSGMVSGLTFFAPSDAPNSTNSVSGSSIYFWGAQLETGSSASEYIPTTTVARTTFAGVTVDGTAAANIPRLDYLQPDGTIGCPALLVEPSAKNFWLQSENLSSASWSKLAGGSGIAPTVSASTESLFGLPTFEVTFTPNGTLSGDTSTIRQGFTPDAIGNHTQSWYIRSLSGTQQLQAFFAGGAFQLTITETPTRITATSNLTSITTWNSGLTQIGTHTRTNGKFLITAAQMEAGSVATSYIPTTTAAVTRNADVVLVTGAVSGSIGQTQGTIYAEVDARNFTVNSRLISISNGTQSNRITTLFFGSNAIRLLATVAGAGQVSITSSSLSSGIIKLAVAYAVNDYAFYINGVQIGTSSSALVPACNAVILGSVDSLTGSSVLNDRIRAASLYTTRLTNTQLALLTSPYTSYSSMASALSYTLG